MTLDDTSISRRMSDLRRAFDESFARAHAVEQSTTVDLVMLRVDGEIYGVYLGEITGFQTGKKITGLPSPIPELLGLLALRGAFVPVYDLGALLGSSAKRKPASTIVAKEALVAFAFDGFERHLRVERQSLARAESSAGKAEFVRELVRTHDGMRPILDLSALVSAVRAKAEIARGLQQDKE
jgi:chemotaxis signal transduction protein